MNQKPMHAGLAMLVAAIVLAGGRWASAQTTNAVAGGPSAPAAVSVHHIGNFGPTGLEVDLVLPAWTIKITGVEKGSPADGTFEANQLIVAINGRKLVDNGEHPRVQLATFITEAEATDGVLTCAVKTGPGAEPTDVVLKLPMLGSYSKTWPLDCPKTKRIVRANAAYIAGVARNAADGMTEHSLENGWAILMLLSTGEEQDLDVVRAIYARRMKGFAGADTGPHTWKNGYQGIAACEYYLRTGDASVLPLIDAICESARKYQVSGGWTHWATGVNPQYTAGGLMNAAGTQVLTTLLLAKPCGAKVDEGTLLRALKFFYRFAGHGSNPYGDHRPEGGYGSDNGKTEMLAIAMGVAARADKGGEVYALARDKSAQSPLYSYPYLLSGHTGPMGAAWHGIAAALVMDKKPELYRNRMEQCLWFYELSRRFDGSFGMCGGERYDDTQYGFAMGLSLTAPLKTLQITGAPRSPYAKSFELPARPWGREADLAFLQTEGGETYGQRTLLPVAEKILDDVDESGLERLASHPEHEYRECTAAAIRVRENYRLIEKLLESSDPRARQTGCMAINGYEPWGLRFSIGVRSRYSLAAGEFSPKMFEALLKIITDPRQALWNVDWALLALAAASPEQISSRLDAILPWLAHDEWWLNESACIALAPALQDREALAKILPPLTDSIARNLHARGRGTMSWFLNRATEHASPEIRVQVARAYMEIYRTTPSVPNPEPGVDHSGITSCALEGTLNSLLAGDPPVVLEGARLSVKRLGEIRPRERDAQIDALIAAGEKLDGQGRRELGTILFKHYRPLVVGDDPGKLKALMDSANAAGIGPMNKLLAIDRMAGVPGGWRLLGNDPQGAQTWDHTSFDPDDKPDAAEMNRYRQVDLPARLDGWFKPEYDPATNGWLHATAAIGDQAPATYPRPETWEQTQLPLAGEVVFTRKTFELADLDFALLRVFAFTKQGYCLYLNGQKIAEDGSRSKTWAPRTHYLDAKLRQYLRPGTNVIAATSFLEYFRGKAGNIEVYVEELRQFPKEQK